MNILQAEHLSKSYGEKVLFDDISFGIEKGQKVALIARNGTGKSTLMRILAGLDSADSGRVTLRNDLRISFLDQNPPFSGDITVLDAIFSSENEALKALHDYEAALELLRSHPGIESERRLSESMQRMDAHRGWDYETRAREILGEFDIHDLSQPIRELSGGQKKKIALAHTLIGEPDFLLLDEPTNHLDMFSTSVLADALENYTGTILFVSHDRTFISRVANKIWWIEDGNIREYPGDFDEYQEWQAKQETMPVKAPAPIVTAKVEASVAPVENKKPSVNKFKLQQLEKEISELESGIQKLGLEIKTVEDTLAKEETARDFSKTMELTELHKKLQNNLSKQQAALDLKMEEWLLHQQ